MKVCDIKHRGNDGLTYEFHSDKNGWFPRLTEQIVNRQQSAYNFPGVDENVILLVYAGHH